MSRPGDFFLVGHHRFDKARGEWMGIVCKQEGTTMTVLTIGSEMSEGEILIWLKETVALMRTAGAENVQAPDMYDRARTKPLN
jgi:hypothetical protein